MYLRSKAPYYSIPSGFSTKVTFRRQSQSQPMLVSTQLRTKTRQQDKESHSRKSKKKRWAWPSFPCARNPLPGMRESSALKSFDPQSSGLPVKGGYVLWEGEHC